MCVTTTALTARVFSLEFSDSNAKIYTLLKTFKGSEFRLWVFLSPERIYQWSERNHAVE